MPNLSHMMLGDRRAHGMRYRRLPALLALCAGLWAGGAANAQNDPFAPVDLAMPKGLVYGSACGEVGLEPEGRVAIERMIARYDTVAIRRWLHHSDPGKRLYAAEAVVRMRRNGLIVAPPLVVQVERMRTATDPVATCSGCIHWATTIGEVMAQPPFTEK